MVIGSGSPGLPNPYPGRYMGRPYVLMYRIYSRYLIPILPGFARLGFRTYYTLYEHALYVCTEIVIPFKLRSAIRFGDSGPPCTCTSHESRVPDSQGTTKGTMHPPAIPDCFRHNVKRCTVRKLSARYYLVNI